MIKAWLLRQMPWVFISLILIGSGWTVGAWLMEKGRKELRPVIEQLQVDLESERAARIRNEEALNAYQKELDSLRNRPRPSTPVRLCVTPPVSNPEFPSPSLDGTTSLSWSNSGQTRGDLVAGPDIGPPLRDLAHSCDAENAKLRALQNWVRSWVQ